MLDQFKSPEEIKKEIKDKKLQIERINSAIQTLWNNYVNGSIPLLRKQEEVDNKLEELELEHRVRSKVYQDVAS